MYTINEEPFLSDSAELLPLPDDLTVVVDRELGCGSGVCGRVTLVGSRTGQSAPTVAERVRAHMRRAHGLDVHGDEWACRRHGPLIDHTDLCVSVAVQAQWVIVTLEGSRAFT